MLCAVRHLHLCKSARPRRGRRREAPGGAAVAIAPCAADGWGLGGACKGGYELLHVTHTAKRRARRRAAEVRQVTC